ncbi:S8 family serine peptidase [Candidatus Magnetominusculus xianensis]|uniref:Subtilisin-like serine protease n=1 Tax=Candidatus Magnetominusculus xianensis TaxID=1748249 RepID=A0ABR5SB45_9BACT|nr:S8 family serine peptidase [Candidatus Magnetominusculus xianensis]KWT76033.1 subtilisin-like serine protease [Candidatus Magnetominusculus xianensis]MBF0405676.1 S8 family serine peptidase [Nitrospirota bacterium]
MKQFMSMSFNVLVTISKFLAIAMLIVLSINYPKAIAQDLFNERINKVLNPDVYNKLVLMAQKYGTVRIIVQVDVQSHPLGWLSKSEADEQLKQVSLVQGKVMDQLASVNVISYYKFKYSPDIAMTVDRHALDTVIAIPEVVYVQEDKLSAPGQVNWDITKVGAPSAWSMGYDGSGHAVAILDTGVDKKHPMLSGKVVSEACYSSNDSTSVSSLCPGGVAESTSSGAAMPYAGNCPTGYCDHGTHVAGTAAGLNTGESSGVAKGANIIAIQVFSLVNDTTSCEGTTPPCLRSYDTDQMKALERVYSLSSTYSIASVNMSISTTNKAYTTNCDSDGRKSKIDNLRSVGIATVISSGNAGATNGIGAPACISTAVSVGSTTSNDAVASSSNSASFLSLLAPGDSIYSSIPNNSYDTMSGTSMAAPHVAGAWAVLKQIKPSASVVRILNVLKDTGVSIKDSRNGLIKPRIQVDSAVTQIKAGTTCSSASKSPVYRFYRNDIGSHFYTISQSEKDKVINNLSNSYSYEGPAYYAFTTQVAGTSPVYRFYRKDVGSHFYTIDQSEKDKVMNELSNVYSYEGPAYYAYETDTSCGSPLYRFYRKDVGSHFYTISESEKDKVINKLSNYYSYEGPVFNAYQDNINSYTLSVSFTGGGRVTSSPAGISCDYTCSAAYTSGTSVTVTATPNSGYRLLTWTGCDSTNGSSCTVSMSSDKSVSPKFTINTTTYFSIKNKNSGKCLNVSAGGLATLGATVQWDCDGSDSELFTATVNSSGYYSYKNKQSKKCLTVRNASTSNNAEIIEWTCDLNDSTGQNQLWTQTVNSSGYYSIKGKQSNKCMDVRDWSTSNGGIIQLYDCTGSDTQVFSFN